MIESPRFLISKDISQRYDPSSYIRNIRIPLMSTKFLIPFFNNFIVVILLDELGFIWFFAFRRRGPNDISFPLPRHFLIFIIIYIVLHIAELK
jgi:hypothetical protein